MVQHHTHPIHYPWSWPTSQPSSQPVLLQVLREVELFADSNGDMGVITTHNCADGLYTLPKKNGTHKVPILGWVQNKVNMSLLVQTTSRGRLPHWTLALCWMWIENRKSDSLKQYGLSPVWLPSCVLIFPVCRRPITLIGDSLLMPSLFLFFLNKFSSQLFIRHLDMVFLHNTCACDSLQLAWENRILHNSRHLHSHGIGAYIMLGIS